MVCPGFSIRGILLCNIPVEIGLGSFGIGLQLSQSFFLCAFLFLTFGEPCADSKRGLLCEAGMEEPGADCLQWEGAGGLCKRMVRKKCASTFMKRQRSSLDKHICPRATSAFSKIASYGRFSYHPLLTPWTFSRLRQRLRTLLFLPV